MRTYLLHRLLWVDCTAAGLAGTLMLALSDWLSQLFALPIEVVLFIGMVNLLYGCYSFLLARRTRRPILLIKLLVYANAFWVLVCLSLAARFWHQASPYGIAVFTGEAMFVGTLAVLQWNQRSRLTHVEESPVCASKRYRSAT